MHFDAIFGVGAAVVVAVTAYNLRNGLQTGVIQYGRSFGRALTVDRRERRRAFSVIVAIHIVFLTLALADAIYLTVFR